jgi:DNA-binding response OmpR family regulator
MNQPILIVDDSLTVRMDLAEAFGAAGFSPVPCGTAAEARAAFARDQPAAVILDVILPDGDGVELLSELRASPAGADLPILILSTEAEVKHRIRGLRTGADEYVGKPYEATYIIARVRELIETARRGRDDASANAARTILVIDDSSTFRNRLREAFETAGYRVLTAPTGEDGLRVAAAQRPNAIVVDGVMPGIDGATVIRRVRLDAALRDTACLLLTASEVKGAELQALDAGADDFAQKGEDVAVILAKLAAMLRRTSGARSGVDTLSLLGPKKILAVDDSPTYLNELAEALRGEEYDVIQVRSGEEALDLLAIQSVDCILLDLMMPGLGGQETCRQIKSAPITRDVPLVMLTALDDRDAMIAGLGAGADDFIQKTGNLEVLKARVRAQIRRKQFEDENRRIRDELLQKELESAEARAARRLVETRASLVDELEVRVAERTADLARANANLRREIEERVRTEAILHDTEEQFRQAQKMEAVGRLAGGIAHDFNNLLAVIISTAQLAESDVPAESQTRADLTQIIEAGTRASNLTKQLLAFSRKQVLQPTVLDLNSVLADLDRMLRRVISEDIEIATVPGSSLASVLADRGQIEQVLLNLVVNSRDAMPDGGKITISTANVMVDGSEQLDLAVGPQVLLAVSDTGCGIDAATRGRIFEPFFTTKEQGKGTGLGLSTAFGIIKQSGGNISVVSEPGHGTTFRIYLPAVDEAPVAVASPPRANVRRATETVLLVEDDVMVRAVAKRILTLQGYTVLETRDADGALEVCRRHHQTIHILLTDVVLPRINGGELAQQIRRLRPGIKVLLMSGYTDAAIISQGLLEPGTHFAEKPFTPSGLATKVREILDQ